MKHIYQPTPDAPIISYYIQCAYIETHMTFTLIVMNPLRREYKGVFVIPMMKHLVYDIHFLNDKVDEEVHELVEWHVAPTFDTLMAEMDSFGEQTFPDLMRLLRHPPDVQQEAIKIWKAIGDINLSVLDCIPPSSGTINELPLHF